MIWSVRVLSQDGRARWSCGAVRHAQAHLAHRRQITNYNAWSFSRSVSFVNCQLSLWIDAHNVPKVVESAILPQPDSRARNHDPSEALPYLSTALRFDGSSVIFDSQVPRLLYCAFFNGVLLEKPIPYSYTSDPPKYALYMVNGSARAEEMRTLVVLGVKPICWLRVHQL